LLKIIYEYCRSERKMQIILLVMACVLLLTVIVSGSTGGPAKTTRQGSTLAIDQRHLWQVITDLQTMGTRASVQEQLAASRYIQKKLRSTAHEPVVQRYEHKGEQWENIVLTSPGNSQPQRHILVIAHYDTKTKNSSFPAPGADDNASGVAVLIELARLVSQQSFSATIQFVFFSNEEKGRAGSKFFARQAKENAQEIWGVVNVDGVGYTPGLAELFGVKSILLRKEQPLLRKIMVVGELARNLMMKPFRRENVLKVVTRENGQFLLSACQANQEKFRLECLTRHET
jgi:hypothetical protein